MSLSQLISSFSSQSKLTPIGQSFDLNEMHRAQAAPVAYKNDPNYFRKCYISALALMKMAIHAKNGGSIEIMGMMTGKVIERAIVVMDVYPLPVEGTETRVNAQAEGYEFMVRYLEANKRLGRDENIVGWYHSHPGYGCWLSGIDVGTQQLNQSFQDPYLAVVVDPIKSAKNGKVEIGAFRTYPPEYKAKAVDKNTADKHKHVPMSKRKDFGSHAASYYALDIEIYCSEMDRAFFAYMDESESNSTAWMDGFMGDDEVVPASHDCLKASDKNSYKESLVHHFDVHDEKMDAVLRLMGLLQAWSIPNFGLKRIDQVFEDTIYKRLLQGKEEKEREREKDRGERERGEKERGNIETYSSHLSSMSDIDESDLDEPERKSRRALDVSDDGMSLESSSLYKNDDDESSDDEMEEFKRRPKEADFLRKNLSREEKLSRNIASMIAEMEPVRRFDRGERVQGRFRRLTSVAVRDRGEVERLERLSDGIGLGGLKEMMREELRGRIFK